MRMLPDILIVSISSLQSVNGMSVASTMHSCLLISREQLTLFSAFLAILIKSFSSDVILVALLE
jgi:hypothetical protein